LVRIIDQTANPGFVGILKDAIKRGQKKEFTFLVLTQEKSGVPIRGDVKMGQDDPTQARHEKKRGRRNRSTSSGEKKKAPSREPSRTI